MKNEEAKKNLESYGDRSKPWFNKYITKKAQAALKDEPVEVAEPVVPEEPKVEVEKENPKKREEELYALNKKEQIALLNDLGAKSIPKLEKDRVKLILKLSA